MGTITKALKLLNYFSDNTHELGLGEFQRISDLNKATVYRYLVELERNGFLEQSHRTKKYRLGAAVLRLAATRENSFPIRDIIRHHVEELSEELRELVHASLIQGSVMSPLCFKDAGDGGTRVYFDGAHLLPMHATASGLAALTYGAPSVCIAVASLELERFTPQTIVDHAELREEVERTKLRGFSESDQNFEAEIHSIAVPFFSEGKFAKGSIAIATPISRMNEENKSKFIHALWLASERISKQLGGRIPPEVLAIWKSAREKLNIQ